MVCSTSIKLLKIVVIFHVISNAIHQQRHDKECKRVCKKQMTTQQSVILQIETIFNEITKSVYISFIIPFNCCSKTI